MFTEQQAMSILEANYYNGIYAIKDEKSSFLVVSNDLIIASGCNKESGIIGKTDFDFFPDPLSQAYHDSDHFTLTQGAWAGLELFHDPNEDSVSTIFTAKYPIYDSEQQTIGILASVIPTSINPNNLMEGRETANS